MPVDVPHPGHVVEVDIGVAARPAVHGQNDLVAIDRDARQSAEKGGIEDMVGHDEQEPFPGQFPRLEDRETVLFLPFLVADGRDRDMISLGPRPEMALDVFSSISRHDDEFPDAGGPGSVNGPVDEAFPATSSSGLLGTLAASRLPRPAAMMTHFSSWRVFCVMGRSILSFVPTGPPL